MRQRNTAIAVGSLLLLNSVLLDAGESSDQQTYQARDTLASPKDDSPDAQACLDGLAWEPAEFEVQCDNESNSAPLSSRLLRFPSPVASGSALNDSVSMEWYETRDADGRVSRAPAVLVVHESGSAMPVGRLFARSLCAKGIHAFLIHLPYYGARRPKEFHHDGSQVLRTMRQAIADVRRARDAIAVLPNIDTRCIGVQGTSLGGFVVATCAGLDRCFTATFIMLAGGDLYGVIANGQKDTADVRKLLAEAGYTGEKLKELVRPIEPTRLAHRLDTRTTWLYSAKNDSVVPLKNALVLAESAGLEGQHHVQVLGNHYTAIAYFPMILSHMVERIQSLAARDGGEQDRGQ